MKLNSKLYPVITFYVLGFALMLYYLSFGWDEFEDNTSYQNGIALFQSIAIVWMIFGLFSFINNSKASSNLYALLINVVGLGICVMYLFNVEEDSLTPQVTPSSSQNSISVFNDTLLIVKEGDTAFYKVGNKVLIDTKRINSKN